MTASALLRLLVKRALAAAGLTNEAAPKRAVTAIEKAAPLLGAA
jgi:hypothetical protein